MAVVNTLPGSKTIRIEARSELLSRTSAARLDARRVENSSRGDEAQIEISLSSFKTSGGPTRSENFSLTLTPDQARALALAICPELA